MPHWYLASWVWDTTIPTRPCWRPPTGCVGAVDLRPRSAQAAAGGTPSGWGFFGFNTSQTLTGADYFGNDPTANMTAGQRTAWRSKLSIGTALTNTRLVDVLAETLGEKSDPGSTVRAKPMQPTRDGNLEIWLAGSRQMQREFGGTADVIWPRLQMVEQDDYRSIRARSLAWAQAIEGATQGDGTLAARVCTLFALRNGVTFATAKTTLAQQAREKFKRYLGGLVRKYVRWNIARSQFIPADLTDEGELPPQTTITDDFTHADGDTIGNQLTWTEVSGDWDTKSNQATKENTANIVEFARAESDLSSADHYAQVKVITDRFGIAFPDTFAGPCVRFAAGATTCYSAVSLSAMYLVKHVNGTRTDMTSAAMTATMNDLLKCDVTGSTITGYQNGVQIAQTTDTAISGNTRCGIQSFAADFRDAGFLLAFDDFEASDGLSASSKLLLRLQTESQL